MDAILERVQNKFACIIGELCSEPVVLSKFAIWLDLRLAEYKAKGAISLDCSGESPDPVWLKGHEVHSPVITRTDDAYSPQSLSRTALPGSKSYQKTRPPEPVVYEENQPDDRLSPGVVVIKEEVTEDDQDVFPISIHRVQPSNQNARKRPLPDSLSRSRDSFSNSSPSKMRHIEDTSISETDNQSLMSIIQDSDPDDHHSTSMTDNDFRTLISSHQPGSATQSRGDNSLAFSPQASSTAAHYSSSPSVSTEDSSSIQHVMSFQSPPGEQSLSQDTGHGADWAVSDGQTNYPHGPPECVAKVITQPEASALNTFGRWLAEAGYDEARPIEQIPPETLDGYLVEFFATVKRKNGSEYQSSGLKEIRKYLQHHLKCHGYPESLTRSDKFAKCREVYLKKVEMLRQMEKLKKASKDSKSVVLGISGKQK
ncbi:uncharacterized protein LOC135463699 isoform X3 [Liolophura sinensis]|uniref:uncharacterized protein LOC135463699 isoform X3 n=1 Tax=Liolophura sinensis TaxID=3198878 RepID=UPI003158ADB2